MKIKRTHRKKGGAAISSVKGIGICILSVTLVFTSAVAAPKIGEKLLPVVLASAGMALPEGGSSLLRGQMEEIKTGEDRKSTRLNSSHRSLPRMPSSA